ncbi:hypothetical protein JXA85_08265 [Candidatus Woesearchaeota archaeon]|nr:hypothetical protein [Candidatus Woesearchaeota archaeon]
MIDSHMHLDLVPDFSFSRILLKNKITAITQAFMKEQPLSVLDVESYFSR